MSHFVVSVGEAGCLYQQLPDGPDRGKVAGAALFAEDPEEPRPALHELEERAAAAVCAETGLDDISALQHDRACWRTILGLELDARALRRHAQDLEDVSQAEILEAALHDRGSSFSAHLGARF